MVRGKKVDERHPFMFSIGGHPKDIVYIFCKDLVGPTYSEVANIEKAVQFWSPLPHHLNNYSVCHNTFKRMCYFPSFA